MWFRYSMCTGALSSHFFFYSIAVLLRTCGGMCGVTEAKLAAGWSIYYCMWLLSFQTAVFHNLNLFKRSFDRADS